MSEKLKIYIARDGEPSKRNDDELFLYDGQPTYKNDCFEMGENNFIALDRKLFPEILNGECFEFELKGGKKI